MNLLVRQDKYVVDKMLITISPFDGFVRSRRYVEKSIMKIVRRRMEDWESPWEMGDA